MTAGILDEAPDVVLYIYRKHAERQKAERAEAWREADAAEAEAGVPSMFSFINNTLGGGSEAAALKRRQHGEFAARAEVSNGLLPHQTGPGDPQAMPRNPGEIKLNKTLKIGHAFLSLQDGCPL